MCQEITGRKLTFPGNIQAESIAGIVLICREGLVFALLQQVKIIPVKHYQGTRIVSSLPVPGVNMELPVKWQQTDRSLESNGFSF